MTEKAIESAQQAYHAHVADHGVDGSTEAITAAIAAYEAALWESVETAPKGEPRRYGMGPRIIAGDVGDGWHHTNIVGWKWHVNAKTGWWKDDSGRIWEPSFWRPLPTPPKEPGQ